MGKKVFKTVLKVAAVAAVAYFAPPLAASIGGSVGITSALGTTALTAGIGAGMGKIIPGMSTTEGLFTGGLAGAGRAGVLGGGATTPTAGVSTTAPAAADTAFLEQATGGALGPAGAGVGAVGGAASVAPTTIGQALSGATANPTNVLTQGLRNITTGAGAAFNAAGLGTTGGLNLGMVAPQLIGGALAGNPMGGIAKAQAAELQRAQQMNAALTQQRLDEATKLIREADYFDPEYMGRQAAEAAMTKGGIAETEGTRGLTGERLAAERRRYRLGTARTAGSAYQQGYGTGVGARVQTRQAGVQAMPSEYPMTNSSSALLASQAARQAKAEEEAGLAAMFGQVLGQANTTSRGS